MRGFWILFAISCAADDPSQRIDVGDNELGVTSIEIKKLDQGDDHIVEVRGLDAGGNEVARVKRRIGMIADFPGGELGSEVTLTRGSVEQRIISLELDRLILEPRDPGMRDFLELAAPQLAQANIEAAAKPVGGDHDASYTTTQCSGWQLLSNQSSRECCWQASPGQAHTVFHNSIKINDAEAIVTRYRNPYGTACKASDGVSSCLGTNCYYGPFGFNTPSISPSNGQYANIYSQYLGGDYSCAAYFQATNPPANFPDIVGSNAPNQGCPGGATGAGKWDW